MVRLIGFEPTRLSTQPPQSCASTVPPQPHIFIYYLMAEERGFEPLRHVNDLLAFQASPFSHLGIPPKYKAR
jgi:hypothetical protein